MKLILDLASSFSFTDEQVLASDFKEEVARMVEVVRPFVHWYV